MVQKIFSKSNKKTNVALAGSDLSINKTPSQKLNLLKTMMKSRAQDAADDIGNYFQSDGTGSGGKAPAGLGNIVDDKVKSVVLKFGYMLENLVRSSVLAY